LIAFVSKKTKKRKINVFYAVNEQGAAISYQHETIEPSVYIILGFLAYAKITGESSWVETAELLFQGIKPELQRKVVYGSHTFAIPKAKSFVNIRTPLYFLQILNELFLVKPEAKDMYKNMAQQCLLTVIKNVDASTGCLRENGLRVGRKQKKDDGSHFGRQVVTLNSFEACTVISEFAERYPELCAEVKMSDGFRDEFTPIMSWLQEHAWDKERGGYLTVIDALGYPRIEPEWNSKVSGTNLEGLSAFAIGCTFDEERWSAPLEETWHYLEDHMEDMEHGAYFVVLSPDNSVCLEIKGGANHGCYHGPGALQMTHEFLQKYIDDKYPALDLIICGADPETCEQVADEILKEAAAALGVPEEELALTLIPVGKNTLAKFNGPANNPELAEKCANPDIDKDIRNRLNDNAKAREVLPDQSLTSHAGIFTGVDDDTLAPYLPKMAEELADIIGMPEKMVKPVDTMHTENGPLVMFEHPVVADIDKPALEELVERMQKQPGLEGLGLADELPYDFLFPVADADKLDPLKDDLKHALACACVTPGIARESDELPELKHEYYKVPIPDDKVSVEPLHNSAEGALVPYSIETPVITLPMVEAIKDHSFDDFVMKELMKNPNILALLKKLDIIDQHNIPLCRCGPDDVNPVLHEVEDDFAKAIDVEPSKVSATIHPEEDNTWVTFTLIKQPGLDDKLNRPECDEEFRKLLAYDKACSPNIPDQRLKDRAFCFHGAEHGICEDHLEEIEDILADVLHIPHEAVPVFDKVVDFPEGPVCVFSTPACVPVTHADEVDFVKHLKNTEGMKDVGLSPSVSYDFPLDKVKSRKLKRAGRELGEGMAASCVSPDLKEREELPDWMEEEKKKQIPYYTGPLPVHEVRVKHLLPMKDGVKVHYGLDTGVLDVPICQAILDDRFNDVVFKELMKRLPKLMDDEKLVAHHEFPIVKVDPDTVEQVRAELEKDMAEVLGVPSEKVLCTLDDCPPDNTMAKFHVKDEPELVAALNAKDTDENFRNAIMDDDKVASAIPDQSLGDECFCLTDVDPELVEDSLDDMKEILADLLGVPEQCLPEINSAERPEGSLVSFNHPKAAEFTPEMLDEFMDRLRQKPGFEDAGLTDKVSHTYPFPKVKKKKLRNQDLIASVACVPVRADMARPSSHGVLKEDEVHEFEDCYYAGNPPLDKVAVTEINDTADGADVTFDIAVDILTNEMVKDMHDDKFDDVIFNETMKREPLYVELEHEGVIIQHPVPLIQTEMEAAKRAQIGLEVAAAESLGLCSFDVAITDFEPVDSNIMCYFSARNTHENKTKLLDDPKATKKIRKEIDTRPEFKGVIPPQSMAEKAVCVSGVPTKTVKKNLPKVEEILNEAMGTPPDTCKILSVNDNPDGPVIVFEHPTVVPATEEKMQDFIDRLRQLPGFRNATLQDAISYLFEFRFGNPEDLDPVQNNVHRGMAKACECDVGCIGIAELTDAGDDMSSVLFGISTDALDADLAKKQEEGLLDDPLLQALFRDIPFAQRLVDRGRIIQQKIPIINANLKSVERVKYGMIQELCHKMDIEEEDMVVITDQNGPHVDMDFYIKATPETIDFVLSRKLRDVVFDYLDSDHENSIPTQAPEDTAVCLEHVPMEVAHPNQPLIQKALGDCVELPPMAMPIYDIIHVPEGPLVILEHPKVAPLDDKAQQKLLKKLKPNKGFRKTALAPEISHDFTFPECTPEKLKGLEPKFIKALSDVIGTPEENIHIPDIAPDGPHGSKIHYKIDTPAINRKFADCVKNGTLNQKIGDQLYDDPHFLEMLEDMGLLSSVPIPLVDVAPDEVDGIKDPLIEDMAQLLEIPEGELHYLVVDDENGPNSIVKFYAPATDEIKKMKDERALDDEFRDIMMNDKRIANEIPDQTLDEVIVCLNSTSSAKVDKFDDEVRHEFAKSLKSPDLTCKYVDNTDIPGGALTVMTKPKIRKVNDRSLNGFVLGLRKHDPFPHVQLTDKVCVAFYFPQVSPEELEPLRGELVDCLSHILEMDPEAIDIDKLTQRPNDDHTQVIYLIDADFLTPKNARILMRADFNEVLLAELQKYPGINDLLTRKGILGRYLTCDISLDNVKEVQLKPYEKDLVDCFERAMGPDSSDEHVQIVAFGEDDSATAVSFQVRETDTAVEALEAPDFESKYMAELAKIPGLAELLGLSKTFLTANIALTDVQAEELEPYKKDIEGCLARALFTDDESCSVTELTNVPDGDDTNTKMGFQVVENNSTGTALRDPEFQNRLFAEFAQIPGLNYLLGLKIREVFDVDAYGEGGIPKLQILLEHNQVFYSLVNMRIKNKRKKRNVPIFIQFVGENAPASKKAELQDLVEEAQTLFGDVEGGLTVTSKDQVTSEQIMSALPSAFHDGDIDLDDHSRKRGPNDGAKMIIGPDGVKRFVRADDDDEEERIQEILQLIHSDMGWINWVVFKTNSHKLELASENSFGSGSMYEMVKHLDTKNVLWGLIRLSFGVRPYRRSHWAMIHWTGPRCPNVKRGRKNAQYGKMDNLLRPFGVALSFNRLEEFTPKNLIVRVRKIVVTDGMDDEGPEDDDAVNALLYEQFKAALAEEEKVNANTTKKLKVDRQEDGELTLQEIVEMVRTPEEEVNWVLISPKD